MAVEDHGLEAIRKSTDEITPGDKSDYKMKVHVLSSDVSFGGGFQYTEGDTEPSITGTAVLWEDTGDTLRTVSAATPFPVEIIAGSSSGTEYTEGDTDASITGVAVLAESPGDTLDALQLDASKNLKVVQQGDVNVTATDLDIRDLSSATDSVSVEGGNSTPVTVDGTVELGATSLAALENITVTVDNEVEVKNDVDNPIPVSAASLPLPADAATETTLSSILSAVDGLEGFTDGIEGLLTTIGGYVDGLEGFTDGIEGFLATIDTSTAASTTSLAIIDDWDESDRAKVNPIVGQAGVQGNTGAVTALTQRVTLATDVALPTGTNSIGQVTANAGTNLNTSALNLEATQADVRTSVQIMDDWDESDRAKVNPIVGQAGVQGGSGTVNALTQRVVLATDVALPTGTNSVGQVTANAGTNLNTSALALESTQAAQSSFDHGSKSSIGTSAVQITASSITAKKGVTVKAAIANTGTIYVGNSDVTNGTTDATDGFELGNGESVTIEVDNANKIYVIASTTSQKVFWAVV